MRLTKRYKAIAQLALFLVPTVLFAQTVTDATSFMQLARDLLNTTVPVLVGLGIVVFLFGVVKYIQAGDKPESRDEGRQFMLYGIIAIFVMVSVWGLVEVLTRTVSLNTSPLPIPQF